ncbi:MAG: PKD domain-containing protein [Bacteroidales bacterium]|nr:PKD domain-containing protein [Bacteroidales bacterium]
MKKINYTILAAFLSLSGSLLYAQDSKDVQHPTLITHSENMIEAPSIESQIASGTFIPAEDRVKEFNPKRWGSNTSVPGKGLPKGNDPLWHKQVQVNKTPGKAPILSFEAASASATPTDPTGAVGPNHFVNSWNSSFRIWDKTGNPLTAAASLGTILPGTLGDPIVIYDPFADRFLITEFYSNGFDVAISKGPNPVTSGWYVYRFPTNTFPDYPKFSVWSDGYYITANKDQTSASTSQVVFALERDKMIAGNTTAQMIGFPLTGIVTSGFYSPLGFNANGPTMPAIGNAPIVYMQDDAWSGVSVDHLKIWSVNVNWTTPASSTISSPQIINTAPFDGLFDGGSFVNLPQPSGSDIDALQATIMYMAQYRRFPTYNTVVFNFVVDLNGADNYAGIRWYELRQTTDGAPWTIYQEGTYAQPNGHSAFSGNMCMDIYGNIGLAYTVVSTTQNPSLRFTGRLASDPLGTMPIAEDVIINGTSVDPSSRYGDYSQMTIDPVDGRTFWSIGEYFSSGRKNRVGVFNIAPPTLTAQFTGTPTTVCAGGSVVFTDQSLASPTSWTWSFPGGTPSSYIGQTPPAITYNTPGIYDVTLTVSDGASSDPEVKTGYITVKSVIANFTGTPVNVVVGNSVIFTDNSSCSPTTWEWSFPGGTPSTFSGQTPPPIVYSSTGTYDVSLIVTKPAGSDTKTRTGYITVSPPIFNIASGTVTTCTGDFYDTGGPTGDYQNNETITETFYPSTTGAMIRFNFTSFATESGYDTLTIYNGINSSAPLIGKYHGTAGPGIVMATNGYGALTFRFRSDVSVTAAGWTATISCVTGFVSDPTTFTASAASTSQIDLAWTKNPGNNNVMIAWSPTSTFGTPVNGTIYTPGGTIAGGGTVLYRGSLTSFNHTTLSQNTTYYYKAYSYDGSDAYSPGLTANATTLCGVYNLPLSENFPLATLPNCWTKQISGTGGVDKWTVSNTANAGGTAYEMRTTWQSVNPGITRLVTPPFNTTGVSQVNLSFKHMLDGYGTGCTLRIQSSTNGSAWTNEAWSVASTATNIGPATVNTTVLNNLNSPNTMIAFTIEGNLYQYDYWYVDDVSVSYTCATTPPVGITIVPSANPVDAGVPVTFTANPVNGGTSPVYQWKINNINVGTNVDSYQYIPVDGDQVSCVLTSNSLCVSGNPATSNLVTMTVNSVPVNLNLNNIMVTGTQCFNAVQTIMVAGSGNEFNVMNGGYVTMIAGQNILYYPGTVVNPGGYMYGYIAPGGPWCAAPTMPVVLTGTNEFQPELEKQFYRIYPNPTDGTFTLELNASDNTGKWFVEIYDMNGQRIISSAFSTERKHEFSLSGKPAGIYLLRVISDRRSGTTRIIKQK